MVAKKKAGEGPDKPVSIRLTKDVRIRLKSYAGRTERPIQDIASEILDEGLKKRGA